ncbi:MAG: cytochrome P460 family protein [Pseudomonadota bacterium]
MTVSCQTLPDAATGMGEGRGRARGGRGRRNALAVLCAVLMTSLLAAAAPSAHAAGGQPGHIPDHCASARPTDLPLPTTVSPEDYQEQLTTFLADRRYVDLGWCVDKGMAGSLVRDTGPYIDGVYYGTHPAVRVYYSPAAMEWIVGDRKGPMKDGAFIVKEMFKPPAARYEGFDEKEVVAALNHWTVMVRDAAGAKDGWYWAEITRPGHEEKGDVSPSLKYPAAGFGQYCVRCHASTKQRSTFSTTRNIKGLPGEPIRYRVDDSWRENPMTPHHAHALKNTQGASHAMTGPSHTGSGKLPSRLGSPNPDFVALFPPNRIANKGPIERLPSEIGDRVVAPAAGVPGFISSDQCMSCHAGLNVQALAGPNLFVPLSDQPGDGYNLSHYGEWRWSPMGLAGRDPIFHAQLDTEIALVEKQYPSDQAKKTKYVRHLENMCFSCHAPMGQRQLERDAQKLNLDPLFRRDYLFLEAEDHDNPYQKYGALGRDGVSCALCHSSKSEKFASNDVGQLRAYLTEVTTGRLPRGEPGEIYGPFEDDDIVAQPMKNALGLEPKHDTFVKSSRMCGSCHVVNLPNLEEPIAPDQRTMLDDLPNDPLFRPYKHTIEQATYLEWLNSAYQDEYPAYNKTPEQARSCQSCHMPESFTSADGKVHVEKVQGRIAAIQDHAHPEADHLVEADGINVRYREEGISRHKFRGLNATLLMMFEQFNELLGVRKKDYMTSAYGLPQALEGYVRQARDKSVDLDVTAESGNDNRLTVEVDITNKAGHRFPSGVGFRRAFLELLVVEEGSGSERTLWSSGRTNSVGALVDSEDRVLPTEFFERDADGIERYQPHHEVITRQDQVQIYEELIQDVQGDFTTSFIRRHKHIKDNRLMPLGWQLRGPIPDRYTELKYYIDATHPGYDAIRDADYTDGKGRDRVRYEITLPEGTDMDKVNVRATLYYQAIPPYWLRQRFEAAPHMPATQRLYHIASHLNLDGTLLEDWKLRLASATAKPSR